MLKSSVFQTGIKDLGVKLRSEVFDGNSDTIIVNNSTNCVIWRHKKNFNPAIYVEIDPTNSCGVSLTVGKAAPVEIGDLNIG